MMIEPTKEQTRKIARGRTQVPGFGPRSFECIGLGSGIGMASVASSGAATPSSIFGADTLQWCRGDLGITIVTGVSAWADQSGLGNSYARATGAAQPTYTASDAGLNNRSTLTFGSSRSMAASGFNLPAPGTTPTFIWMVVKLIAWVSGGRFVDGESSTSHILYQNGTTPNIEQYNAASVNGNTGLALGTWAAVGVGFNNATTDFVKINDIAKVTGAAAGNSASNGRQIGVGNGGAANFSNMAIAEILYAKRMPSAGDLTALSDYRLARYGF